MLFSELMVTESPTSNGELVNVVDKSIIINAWKLKTELTDLDFNTRESTLDDLRDFGILFSVYGSSDYHKDQLFHSLIKEYGFKLDPKWTGVGAFRRVSFFNILLPVFNVYRLTPIVDSNKKLLKRKGLISDLKV